MKKIQFTDKVGAKEMSFLIDESRTLHTAWFPHVETIEGTKLTIKDDDAPAGIMEAESRYKAIKKGKLFLQTHNSKEIKNE